jgi:hypothetical protein
LLKSKLIHLWTTNYKTNNLHPKNPLTTYLLYKNYSQVLS